MIVNFATIKKRVRFFCAESIWHIRYFRKWHFSKIKETYPLIRPKPYHPGSRVFVYWHIIQLAERLAETRALYSNRRKVRKQEPKTKIHRLESRALQPADKPCFLRKGLTMIAVQGRKEERKKESERASERARQGGSEGERGERRQRREKEGTDGEADGVRRK